MSLAGERPRPTLATPVAAESHQAGAMSGLRSSAHDIQFGSSQVHRLDRLPIGPAEGPGGRHRTR